MTLPTVPPRDPEAPRPAEAERLRRIVEPAMADGFWTTDEPISSEQWRRCFLALPSASRNLPLVIDGITWRYERAR